MPRNSRARTGQPKQNFILKKECKFIGGPLNGTTQRVHLGSTLFRTVVASMRNGVDYCAEDLAEIPYRTVDYFREKRVIEGKVEDVFVFQRDTRDFRPVSKEEALRLIDAYARFTDSFGAKHMSKKEWERVYEIEDFNRAKEHSKPRTLENYYFARPFEKQVRHPQDERDTIDHWNDQP